MVWRNLIDTLSSKMAYGEKMELIRTDVQGVRGFYVKSFKASVEDKSNLDPKIYTIKIKGELV